MTSSDPPTGGRGVVPVLQMKRREGIEGIVLFLTATMNSVRIFFQVGISLCLIKMSSLPFRVYSPKKPIKSPFCLGKAHTYSFNSAKIAISGSQRSQTRKLKYHKSTRNFTEEIEK